MKNTMKKQNNQTENIFSEMFHELEGSGELYVEWAKVEAAEQIHSAMKQQSVSKAELARRLEKSRAYITQVLQGNANFTLESLVIISRALNCTLELKFNVKKEVEHWEFHNRNVPMGRVLAWRERQKVQDSEVQILENVDVLDVTEISKEENDAFISTAA